MKFKLSLTLQKNLKFAAIIVAGSIVTSSEVWAAASKSGHHDHAASISSLGWYCFNFLVYCGILYLLVRKPAAKAWAERCRKIGLHVNAAQNQLSDAKARLAHAQVEAAALDARIKTIQASISNSTELEQARILEATAEQVSAIAMQTELLIEAERQAQLQAVEREVSARILEKAEQALRSDFKETDDQRYRATLSDNLKSLRML